ncbi:phosphotyrosine protein phosphatase [uncultured Eubacterium sp.]|uniref:arsenate reductase/protein-tyrosine-phosphatase family protein n=1 Tax=uncultured Eubacterium sp. TaxID=165185 RepID=UPI0026726B69|nr:phosphotyrosine protein phosphatase [uncultured Eubacterium sp.]
MLEYSKILFVTDMDTSPGPLAAALLKHYLPLENAEIDSRGLAVLFPEPMNPKTVAIAASKGLDINRSSKQLEAEDFGKDVLVLVLDAAKKQTVYDDYTEAVNVYTLKEFINEEGSINNPDGGELSDYAKLYDILDDVIIKLANKLKGIKA